MSHATRLARLPAAGRAQPTRMPAPVIVVYVPALIPRPLRRHPAMTGPSPADGDEESDGR